MPQVTYVGLGVLLGKAGHAVDQAKDEIAEKTMQIAQDTAPVLTGTLAGSIHREGDSVVASTEYAGYVEVGTSDTPAFRFMEQAAMQVVPEAQQAMAENARREF